MFLSPLPVLRERMGEGAFGGMGGSFMILKTRASRPCHRKCTLTPALSRSTWRGSVSLDALRVMSGHRTQSEGRLDYGIEPSSLNYGVNNDPPPVPPWARYAAGALLLCLVLPAAFGFLASFELGPNNLHWRIGYAIFGLSCLVSGLWLILKK
jgi:hypothetical protein